MPRQHAFDANNAFDARDKRSVSSIKLRPLTEIGKAV